MADAQTYENHRRFHPLYHGVAAPIIVFYLGWTIYRLIHAPSVDAVITVLVAFVLVVMLYLVRQFALRAQDRVIRLETRLRLSAVLPQDLQPRIGELEPGQLIAMRFASDAELPDLARKVLAGNIRNQTTIKKMIQEWQADHLRV